MNNSVFTYDERLDTDFLNSLYEDDTEYAAIVFEQFLHSCKDQLKDMDTYFAAGEIELFKQRVHKMKPTFSFVGLTQLTAKAEQIEAVCKQTPEIQTIRPLYTDFVNTLQLMIPVVESEYERLKS